MSTVEELKKQIKEQKQLLAQKDQELNKLLAKNEKDQYFLVELKHKGIRDNWFKTFEQLSDYLAMEYGVDPICCEEDLEEEMLKDFSQDSGWSVFYILKMKKTQILLGKGGYNIR